MGKQKGESARTKARASSSSLAASLVPTGSAPIGFGGYVGSSRVDSVHGDESTSFAGIDGEMVQYLKRLARKDPVTKLKALNSLSALLKNKSGKDVLPIIPQWGFEYRRLLMDYNREVRRATHETMTSLVAAAGRDLAVHLKSLMGPWWFAQFDSVSEVSQAAKRSLQAAFPTQEKRLEALIFCASEVFEYLEENLKLTQQGMADLAAASDELADMHQRVISSSLLALATLLDVLIGVQSEKPAIEDSNIQSTKFSKARDMAISSAKTLFVSHHYFLDFLKSESPAVRSATYAVLRSFVKNICEVFSEDVKGLATAILGAFQEKDPSCHTALWETFLLFTRRFPGSWSYVNFQKIFSNRFWQFLKNGCFGSQQVSYPALVLLLDALPAEVTGGHKYFVDFFQNLWAGRNASHPSNADRLAFFVALKECLLWVLHNCGRYCSGDDAIYNFRMSLVDNVLVKLLWHDFLVYSEARHEDVSTSSTNGDAFSETSRLLDKSQLEVKQGQLHDLGCCIIDILSAIYSLECKLLNPFCGAFQGCCFETFQQTEHVKEASGNIGRARNFLVLVEKYAVLRNESWPLDYLVGPMLERSLPLIMSHESIEVVKFLSVVVSIFGPRKIVLRLVPSEGIVGGSATGQDDREASMFLKVFEETFVSWCFSGSESAMDAHLDLLLALLDNKCFKQQWNIIITYATNMYHSATSHIGRLSILIQKARNLTKRLSKLGDDQISQIANWQHELLDSIAVTMMQNAPTSTDSDLQFIRAVLGGTSEENDSSFLSKNAVVQIYTEAFGKLLAYAMESPFACVKEFVSLTCSQMKSTTPEIQNSADVVRMAYTSLEVLRSTLFSLKSYCEESELLVGIGGIIFVIDWEYDVSRASDTKHNGASVKSIMPRQEFGKVMHAFRTSMSKQFWRSLVSQSRMTLGNLLIKFIRSAIFEQDVFDAGVITSLCCKWMIEVSKHLCLNQLEEQKLVELLLNVDKSWPLWINPDNTNNERKHGFKVEGVITDIQILQSQVFVALVDKLISEMGINRVLVGSDLQAFAVEERGGNGLVSSQHEFSRAWVVAEMLCNWKWPDGSALDTLLPSLSSHAKSESDGSLICLFDSTVNILLEGALVCGTKSQLSFFNTWPPSSKDLDYIEEPFLRALVTLLFTLLNEGIWNQEKAVGLWELLLNKLYVGQEANMNCLRILPPLVSVLAHFLFHNKGSSDLVKDSLPDSFRETIVREWLEKTLTFPSLISWTSGEEMEEWFQLVLSCYPLSTTADVGHLKLDASSLEQKLLLAVFRKQRHDANSLVVTNELPVVSLLLSRLMVIAVGYCWEEFDEEDWKFVLYNLRHWIELVVTTMEEAAECLDLETGNESGDNLDLVISKLKKIMQNLDTSLMNIATNALYAFSLVMELVGCNALEKAENLTVLRTEVCHQTIDLVLEGILRIFFSVGIAEAISSSLSCQSLSIIAKSHRTYPHFWNLVSSIALKSSTHSREQAFKAVELWGLRTGAISSLMAILFSPKPVSVLQLTSFVLLSSQPFSSWALVDDHISDSSSSTVDVESRDLDSSSENNFTLREGIHCLIHKLPLDVLDMDLEAQERVHVFLAWCLILSYLVSLPSSSSNREKLVQQIQESASSAILDCLFQHIPVELCVAHGLKKRDLETPPELLNIATAATRAISTGSILFAVESLWPIGPEKMASLAAAIFGLMLRVLPAYVRVWFNDLRDRYSSSAIESFTKTWCSPHLMVDELSQIKKSDFVDECFAVSVSKSANEVIATYTKDETSMDLVIRLPASYPLRSVDVECTRSLGISEVKQRKWLLSMMAFVRNQNGALAEAIRIWKSNFDKEFEGVEECPICYSVIHTTNHSLPRLACKTCKHKFHAACLYKWFSTSHKSTCPLCQSPF
ncbi:E3 ubiquitin-protein ligase listerin-like [Chenopodium quinoa]|uniref:E3 ubiquitin-protein ligase listerin n=1 Tax=Chenopodium quinoa TaxID=63459 RepID=A0A803M8T5_CHEQI|nr:E3 ubiquitin-protein ligase listerin-like [Chenopodium quinoa]